ncbi:MAG: DNA phosphorothioation-dependent restriction protein DptF [Erysipelotrichaceae bacterium]|nr:DNA phosphorothioation-dependent restriction protein DptF [Erysipelotrichaceae bacterium]
MALELKNELHKLEKSSAESVANTEQFSDFKKYMHVDREADRQLKELLRNVNQNADKSLVLVCGSAGDGKSHLLSYLNNADDEKLLEGYEVYNDATESEAPDKTNIQTLADRLKEFADDKIDLNDHTKKIIGINLGTLANFVDSEYGQNFTRLKQYVEDHKIFTDFNEDFSYDPNSPFQSFNFSDYQIFSLGEDGITTDFVHAVFKKVFEPSDENPFYQAYKKDCDDKPTCSRNPIVHNFEFLMDENVQDYICNQLVEVVLTEKITISARDLMDFIYNLLVHPKFQEERIMINYENKDSDFFRDYLKYTTPMILYNEPSSSKIINAIQKHDLFSIRTEEKDRNTMMFHVSDQVQKDLLQATENTPYQKAIDSNGIDVDQMLEKSSGTSTKKTGEASDSEKKDLRQLVYLFSQYLSDMKKKADGTGYSVYAQKIPYLEEFVKNLYYQESNQTRLLGDLSRTVINALNSWNGKYDENQMCIERIGTQMFVFGSMKIKADINRTAKKEGRIQRFSPNIVMRFMNDRSLDPHKYSIRIDYSLFALLHKLNQGYELTFDEYNKHREFLSFVQQIIEHGVYKDETEVILKSEDKLYKGVLTFDESFQTFDFSGELL